jgi:glycyl-tRNA synthetase
MKPTFGVAQIGKSFRNEITQGSFVFRTREFEQMELEFFVAPDEAERWHEYWLAERFAWYLDLAIRPERLRLRPHEADKLSHYSSGTSDVEYLFPWRWDELEGIAKPRRLRPRPTRRALRAAPGVLRPGLRRAVRPARRRAGRRRHPRGVRPPDGRLLRGGGPRREADGAAPRPAAGPVQGRGPASAPQARAPRAARDLARELRGSFMCDYDETASVGKRYRRQDEIGTPFCITVDPDTLTDGHVTIRARDPMEQVRVPRTEVETRLHAMLKAKQTAKATSEASA